MGATKEARQTPHGLRTAPGYARLGHTMPECKRGAVPGLRFLCRQQRKPFADNRTVDRAAEYRLAQQVFLFLPRRNDIAPH